MKANVRNVKSSFAVICKHKMQETLLCHANIVECITSNGKSNDIT